MYIDDNVLIVNLHFFSSRNENIFFALNIGIKIMDNNVRFFNNIQTI